MAWKPTDRSRMDLKLPAPCALWPVDVKLTHTHCNPERTLVHFQGQYSTICELDYNILQVEIQNVPKTAVSVEVGDFCLVEDFISSRWYRGRVQSKSDDSVDVFLLDYGNILTVGASHLSTVSDSLFMLPPKIVRGLIANVLPDKECWDQPSEAYFSSLISRTIKGYIHGFLPHKVLILEVPEITKDLLRLSSGRHVNTDTFLLLVELTLEVPIQQSCESVPDLLIEKQIAQEISFKSTNLCGYENILSLCGSKLVVGQKERIRISAALNTKLFYCQLSSAAKDLKEMSEKLALVSESMKGDFRDKLGENMGLLCAIKGKDEKWHRGLVQSLPVNAHVRVVFVDYGYCESVKVESVFQLPSDFLRRPVMAFPCTLSCLGDEDKVRENQQLVHLRNGLMGKELLITVDDLSKERKTCSVTLSNVVKCAPMKTLQSKEVHQMEVSGVASDGHGLSCFSNGMKNVGVSENLVASEHVQCGSVFEGYVEHVQSPHDFWVRTAKSNDRFKAMMNKLTDWFGRLELNKEILQHPVPGQLCCAMYEKDMHYYRALVVDILEYGAEVFFLDFGNTEKVPSMLIKKIPTEFTTDPAFAFNCSLAHLVPLKDVWTSATTDFFRKVILHKVLLIHVIYKRSDVFVVELYEKGFEKSESVTTILTNAKMAEFWTYRGIKTSGPLAGTNNETGSTYARGKHAQIFCKKKLPSKMTKQENIESRDERFHGEITECSAVGKKIKDQTFMPGAVMSVQCSHISSPSDFWCQDKKSQNELERLMERLQTFYQTNTSVLHPSSACCAVRSQLDNKWYRGCILGGTGSSIKVILVDYGMVVQEKLQNLRALKPEFFEFESQAFRCRLYNLFDPVAGEVWSDEACTLLKYFTSKSLQNLKCQIYSKVFVENKGLCNMVDLFRPQRASTYLVKKGVAKEMQHPHQLPSSVRPCSFVYSSFDITVGGEETVFPTHVVSPWEIYFQLEKNTTTIEQLMDMAMKESEELMSRMNTSKTGSMCLAKYSEDGKWYRSHVWPAQSSLHLNVFFVDYGGKQVVEKSHVLTIPMKAVDLLFTPMQALRCSLLSVPEEEHLPEVNTWIEKATLNKGIRAKFAAANSGHFICDLFDGDIHINQKVKEIFEIHRQSGKSLKKPISDSYKKAVTVSSVGKDLKTKGRNHMESVAKSQRRPGNSRNVQGHGQSCEKQSSQLKSEQESHSVNNTTSKNDEGKEKHSLKHLQKEKCTIPHMSNMQSAKVLPRVGDLPAVKIVPGFRTTAVISHKVNSVCSFFIQMEKDKQKILKMREELQNCSPFTTSLQSPSVKVGDLVAARHDEDLVFYRAAVKRVASSGYITVEFIDYGNTATVDKEKIKPLARKFLSEARLSIHCKLSKTSNLDVGSFLSVARKPVIVEFKQYYCCAWEVSIQGLDPLHDSSKSGPAVGSKGKISDLDQAKPKQEMYAAVHCDDTSLMSFCEKTKAETASIKKDTTTLEHKTKGGNIIKEETFKNEQAKRATREMEANRKACTYKRTRDEKQDVCRSRLPEKPEMHISGTENDPSNRSDYSCDGSVEPQDIAEADAQDIIFKKSQSVVHRPSSEHKCFSPTALPQEKPVVQDEVRHLFAAPVKKNHEYSGFAAAVTTPGEFNVVLEDLFLIMSTVSNVLEDLPELLPPLLEAHLIPGTGCLVKCEEKKKWCRAEIIHYGDVSVILNLVDYGYFVHLPCHDIGKLKVLPVELAELPKITYSCTLRGIKPADELQWSDQAAMFFQQCMYEKNLKIYFRQQVSEARWEVDVTSDRNVGKELVDAGFAHYIDDVLGIRFQQPLGHKMITSISVDNVHKATSKPEQTQSKMDIYKSCNAEMDTEDPVGESWNEHGPAQKTYDLQSTLSQSPRF